MADNIQIPQDVAKIVDVKVIYNTDLLRKLLTDLVNEVNQLKNTTADHETRITSLE